MAYRRDNKGRFTKNDENKKYMHGDLVPETVMPLGKKMFAMYKDGSYAVFEDDKEVLYKDLHAVVEDFMKRYQPCTAAAGTENKKEEETESAEKDEKESKAKHYLFNKDTGKYINGFEQYNSELRQIFDYDNFVICVYQDCTIHIYEKIPSSKYDDGFYLNRIDGDNFTTEKNWYTYMEDFDSWESDEDEECEWKCDKCEDTECVYHPASKDGNTKSEENASDNNKDDTESEDECNGFAELKSCSGCEDAYSEGYANALENVIGMFIDALIDRDCF